MTIRKKIIAGNWKMNCNLDEAVKLCSEIVNISKDELQNKTELVIIPPFPLLGEIKRLSKDSKVKTGAQNCHQELSGAYTGEVSAALLASMAVDYVIIGHSERRQYFHETNELLAKKLNIAISQNLTPIYCCGETLEQRENGNFLSVNETQIEEALFHLNENELKQVVIAYEPVWAIGTGKTASSEQAQEVHAAIRSKIASKYGEEIAQQISILYGGSVKPSNAKELFSQQDIDGGLIGGASLNARDFIEIAKSF